MRQPACFGRAMLFGRGSYGESLWPRGSRRSLPGAGMGIRILLKGCRVPPILHRRVSWLPINHSIARPFRVSWLREFTGGYRISALITGGCPDLVSRLNVVHF